MLPMLVYSSYQIIGYSRINYISVFICQNINIIIHNKVIGFRKHTDKLEFYDFPVIASQ